jgi:inner membrane protein
MPLPAAVVMAGAIGSILPDIDVVSFRLGIPYGSLFGHRGFTHSIVFALVMACIGALLLRIERRTFAFVFLCTLSHGLLDAMTNGGRGVAFFSPFSNRRFFFPWRPIEVSSIGHLDFDVLVNEIKWVWLPCGIVGLVGWLWRRRGAEEP